MNKAAIAKFIGVFFSLLVIWKVNDVLLIDVCIEQGGVFQYNKGECLLADGSIYTTGFEVPLVFAYVVIGLSVSYFVSKFIGTIFKNK
jgi:hypothetical protein